MTAICRIPIAGFRSRYPRSSATKALGIGSSLAAPPGSTGRPSRASCATADRISDRRPTLEVAPRDFGKLSMKQTSRRTVRFRQPDTRIKKQAATSSIARCRLGRSRSPARPMFEQHQKHMKNLCLDSEISELLAANALRELVRAEDAVRTSNRRSQVRNWPREEAVLQAKGETACPRSRLILPSQP